MKFYNDLLSPDELRFVQNILSGDHWGFGYTSTDANKPIWNFNKSLGETVATLIASKLEYKLDDWHINGQTFLLDGSPHTDDYNRCTHAFVFFPFNWEYVWGGRLNIMTSPPTIVTPQCNFGVLFKSSLVHYADAPVAPVLRISVGLKLNEIH